MIKLEKVPINTYFFTIFDNPVNGKKFLIFRGVGTIDKTKNTAILNDERFWGKNASGFLYAKNYCDMFEIYKQMPCCLINKDNKLVSFTEYSSQDEIAEKFNIFVSRLARKPHKFTDTYEHNGKRKRVNDDASDDLFLEEEFNGSEIIKINSEKFELSA